MTQPERICGGEVANFNAAPDYGSRPDPVKPAPWPQSRVLRRPFLEAIPLKDPYSCADSARRDETCIGGKDVGSLRCRNLSGVRGRPDLVPDIAKTGS